MRAVAIPQLPSHAKLSSTSQALGELPEKSDGVL